ncbi:MAG: hypothetical protein V8T16_15795 [Parabacteroides merdae]
MLENADLILYAGSFVPKELTLCAKNGASSPFCRHEPGRTIRPIKKFYDKGKSSYACARAPCSLWGDTDKWHSSDRYGMSDHITPGISSFELLSAALRSSSLFLKRCKPSS